MKWLDIDEIAQFWVDCTDITGPVHKEDPPQVTLSQRFVK